ncbi:hypothetical protein JFL43_19900 [Viridibacillus sp. YIM B01967]|uniref:ABC transporter permease n=1 Tax=Viridibacillus soli TaxID=2798301 RepID=A0ABS1HDK8_9BACL|nr:hypothetical protein [Viridibacillus soli]MBK3497058.1 hypothetical protein [Viridibacillus soli]
MKGKDELRVEEKISAILDSYKIDDSLDTKKQKTKSVLEAYLPVRQPQHSIVSVKVLIKMALQELFLRCKIQLSIFLLVLVALMVVIDSPLEKYLMMIFTAPIPLFICFWQLFGKYDQAMEELEHTFKCSFNQMFFSKVVAIIGIAILFITIPAIQFLLTGSQVRTVELFQLIILGLTPICLFSLMLLVLVTVSRNVNIMLTTFLIWMLFGFSALSTQVGELLVNVNVIFYAVVIVVSTVSIILKLKQLLQLDRKDLMKYES